MCRPVVQSSYGIRYMRRARQDHDRFFARPASCYALFTLALQCVSPCDVKLIDVLRPSGAGEERSMRGKGSSITSDMIILQAERSFPAHKHHGLPKFSLECHTVEESGCC